MRATVITLLLLAALVPFAPGASGAAFTVSASNFVWTPSSLAIEPGDSVTFSNGGGSHNWVRADEADSCRLPCTRSFSTAATVEYQCGVHPSMTGTIVVSAAVAVAITSPSPGASVSGLLLVTGTAAHPSADIESVTVRLGAVQVEATLQGAGPSVTWSAQLQTLPVPIGAADLTAEAQSVSGARGSASVPVIVANAPFVDLRVASVAPQTNALLGNVVSFTVASDGNAPSPASDARGEYFHDGAWHAFGSVGIASLAPGATASSSLTWDPAGVAIGAFDIRVVVDPDALLADVDRDDNVGVARGAFVTSALPGIVVG